MLRLLPLARMEALNLSREHEFELWENPTRPETMFQAFANWLAKTNNRNEMVPSHTLRNRLHRKTN
jgi:hypothetical protein